MFVQNTVILKRNILTIISLEGTPINHHEANNNNERIYLGLVLCQGKDK